MTWISVCWSVPQSLYMLNVLITAAGASEVLLCLVRPCQALPFVTTFQPNLASSVRPHRYDIYVCCLCRSLLDNFEWQMRMSKRFGVVFVDLSDGAQRHIKDSGRFIAALFGTANGSEPAAAPASAPVPSLAAASGPGPAYVPI